MGFVDDGQVPTDLLFWLLAIAGVVFVWWKLRTEKAERRRQDDAREARRRAAVRAERKAEKKAKREAKAARRAQLLQPERPPILVEMDAEDLDAYPPSRN